MITVKTRKQHTLEFLLLTFIETLKTEMWPISNYLRLKYDIYKQLTETNTYSFGPRSDENSQWKIIIFSPFFALFFPSFKNSLNTSSFV